METLNDITFGKKLEYLEDLLKVSDFDVIFFVLNYLNKTY